VPFAVGALIVTNIAAIGFAELQISTLAKSSQELAAFTQQNDGSIKELEVLAKGIEFDIVATQEALTDVSATRGMDGLDDGFALADESAAALAEKTNRVIEISDRLGEPELGAAMVSLGEKFAVFRDAGIEMAKAYVAGGPAEGNKLMASFDQVADNLQQEIEAPLRRSMPPRQESTPKSKPKWPRSWPRPRSPFISALPLPEWRWRSACC
jgi:methyl-accepting chemotaxis protein